jgi:hypothetical protein
MVCDLRLRLAPPTQMRRMIIMTVAFVVFAPLLAALGMEVLERWYFSRSATEERRGFPLAPDLPHAGGEGQESELLAPRRRA